MTAGMRHVPRGVKLGRLTRIPPKSAPNVPTMESYGGNDEVIRVLDSLTLSATLPGE